MFCPKCGSQIPSGAQFCPNCGIKIQPEALENPQGHQVQDAQPSPPPVHRESRMGIGIAAVACICAILAVVIVVWSLAGGGNTPLSLLSQTGSSTGGASAGSTGTDTSAEASTRVDPSSSTPVGNLVNGGYVCEDDENVYYAVPIASADDWFTNGIVRRPKDGSAEQAIYTTDATDPVVYHLNVTSGRIIFTEVTKTGTQVKSVGIDGSSPEVLTAADDSSLVQVYKGHVYYSAGGTLKVMDPDGTNVMNLMSVSGELWRICDDAIVHFASQDATTVSKANLDGSDDHVFITTDLSQHNEQIANVIPNPGNGLYEVLAGVKGERGGYAIYGYDANGSQSSGLDGEAEGGWRINRFNPTEDGMVFLYDHAGPDIGDSGAVTPPDEHVVFEKSGTSWTDPNDTLYDTNDSAVTLMSPAYIDGYVYFAQIKSGDNALMRIPVTGGSPECIA